MKTIPCKDVKCAECPLFGQYNCAGKFTEALRAAILKSKEEKKERV